MFHVRHTTLAWSTPSVDVETFASRQPVLADFLRPSWYKLESLAIALVAVVLNTAILKEGLLMTFKKMAAEAS